MTDLATVGTHWDKAAHGDVFYNILADDEKRGGKWTPEEFFAHGEREIATMMDRLAALDLPTHGKRALDFGCGVGRLTQALAAHFDRVVGVDISPEMIRQAKALNHKRGVTFRLNTEPHLKQLRTRSFDFIYSMIALQHMPQHLAQGYVEEFVRLLRGVALIEIPGGREDCMVEAEPWFSMWSSSPAQVEEWITGQGGSLIDVQRISPESSWDCNLYVFKGATE